MRLGNCFQPLAACCVNLHVIYIHTSAGRLCSSEAETFHYIFFKEKNPLTNNVGVFQLLVVAAFVILPLTAGYQQAPELLF